MKNKHKFNPYPEHTKIDSETNGRKIKDYFNPERGIIQTCVQ